jgi:hypothetical protein
MIRLLAFALTLAAGAASTDRPVTRSRGVPAPWTPLTLRGGVVRCWGREYLTRGALPRQIVSQRVRLLAGPIGFRFDGEPSLRWRRTPLVWRPRIVRWGATARRGSARLNIQTAIEYDGFWQVDVDLGKGLFRGVSLEIPLASRHARYLHFVNATHYSQQNTLALAGCPGHGRARDGVLWSSSFACMAWVGDEKVGLAWCADSDAPFRLTHPERALAIHREGAVTTLRIRLIDHPVTLAEPLHWRFGLIATPVRPMPPRWRDWRLGPGASANTHILWWNSWAGSHADPTPKDAAALAERARQNRARGQFLLPYVALLGLSERSPAYRAGGDRWRREPFSRLEDEGTPYWIICPNSRWQSYFPAQMARLCREIGLNGLYLDFTFPYRCSAAHHPCGYLDARGARRGEFRVFALRKLAQATYEQVKAARPDARILMHTSGALMYPYIGFADMMLNGEQLRRPLARAGGRYLDVLPLAVLRAEYRGQQAGLAPFLIPELATPAGLPDPTLTAVPGPTKEMLALTLLHDVGVWPIYCHQEAVEAVRQAQRRFGIAEAHFVPYWETGGPVVITGPSLLASAWIKRAGALLVVVNRGRQAVGTRLRLRPRVSRGRWAIASDALTGEAVAGDGTCLSLSVPARGFRLLRLLWHASGDRRRMANLKAKPLTRAAENGIF